MADINKAVELARRVLEPAPDGFTVTTVAAHMADDLARAVLAMAAVMESVRAWDAAPAADHVRTYNEMLNAIRTLDAEARRG